MVANLGQLVEYRELLAAWIVREIRARYKQTALGVAWAIIQPLSLMLVFVLVFGVLVDVPLREDLPYPVFAYSGLLAWTFTATSVSFGATSLTRNIHALTTVYFPREILPIASVAASLIDSAAASAVFLGLLIAYRIRVSPYLFFVPIILTIQILLTLGITFWLSALNVFWRDVRFALPLILQLWLYGSPIVYPLELVPDTIYPYYILNPMVGIIDSYRCVALRSVFPDWGLLGVASAISIALLLTGYAYFKHSDVRFADVI